MTSTPTQINCPGLRSCIMPVAGFMLSRPWEPIIDFAEHRKKEDIAYYFWCQSLRDPDEAARKWAAFSNLPSQNRRAA